MSRVRRISLWHVLLTVAGPSCIRSQECMDHQNMCMRWASEGRCDKEDFMRQYCPMSCQFCSTDVCTASGTCSAFSGSAPHGGFQGVFWNNLDSGPVHIEFLSADGKEIRLGTVNPGSSQAMQTYPDHIFQFRDAEEKVIGKVRMYTGHSGIVVDDNFRAFSADCKDKLEDPTRRQCAEYAARGSCTSTPGFMILNCAKTCSVCHLQTHDQRCQRRSLNMSQMPAVQKGDVDLMFQGLKERWPQYNTTVISKAPWIVTFDDFISAEEIEDLKRNMPSFARSGDTGARDQFGKLSTVISDHRTSTTAWCQGACESSMGYLAVRSRIAEVIGVPTENHENLQFLNYGQTQYYKKHHDMSEDDHVLASGPRIYTFFLYLSDVDEGGETDFPEVGITVKPRKGSALLWPSVLSDNPTAKDNRTNHQALPVKRGLKIAANAFVRLFDYKVPNYWACTGA